MSVVLKRNLILITALVYTAFACSYVLLCSRDARVVNLFDCFYSSVSKPKATQLIKRSPTNRVPLSHKFLSRPRVVTNKTAYLDFSIVAITFLSLFIFFAKKEQSFLLISTLSLFDPCPGIIFLRNWRI